MKKHIVRGNPYFSDITKPKTSYPILDEDITTDVLIVGGGITGLLCAYYFNKNNVNTTIVEKNRLAMGSTSITTSLLQYELDELLSDIEKKIPLKTLIDGYKLGTCGLEEIQNIVSELDIDCDLKLRNCLLYTDDKKTVPKLEYEYKIRKDNKFPVEFLNKDDKTRFEFPMKAGLLSIGGGLELNPVKLAYGLANNLSKSGVKIFEKTEVFEVNHLDDCVIVKACENTIICKKLIVATGYDISLFTKEKFCTLYTTYNIVTKPLKENFSWEDHCLIRTTEDPYIYLRTTPDNRIIIGGEDTRFIPEVLENSVAELRYNKLEKRLHEMFPNINFNVEFKYNGLFGATNDNLPYIGPDPKNKNIWYCLGYGANGILFSTVGSKILSDLYLGKLDERLSLIQVTRK